MKPFLLAAMVASCLAQLSCSQETSSPVLQGDGGDVSINVCLEESEAVGCDYIGSDGLQTALREAPNAATMRIHPGEYVASSFSDTPFQDIEVRSYLKVENKALTIVFEEGAILIPNDAFASSAMVALNADLSIDGFAATGFRYGEAEDNYYDGHGLFVIGGKMDLTNAVMHDIEKMSLTGRNDAVLNVSNLTITDSHMGVWLEEEAQITLSESKISGIESAGIAAYDRTIATITNSVFERCEDDGLYTENGAKIEANNVVLRANSPYAARAAESSSILLENVQFSDNKEDIGEEGEGRVVLDKS